MSTVQYDLMVTLKRCRTAKIFQCHPLGTMNNQESTVNNEINNDYIEIKTAAAIILMRALIEPGK